MMDPKEFFLNKKVIVLGLGQEGIASAEFASKFTNHVSVIDERSSSDFNKKTLAKLKECNVNLLLGQKKFSVLSDYDIIIRSPGVNLRRPELEQAKKSKKLITSQTKLFFDFCPCPIIGITGTKGKSTVSSLIYNFLKNAIEKKAFKETELLKPNSQVFLTGNIGTVAPFDILEKLKNQDLVVYEASSFQLEDSHKSPHLAVLTEISKDHLDYHKTLALYIKAKTNLVKFQSEKDFVVFPQKNTYSSRIALKAKSKKFPVVMDTSNASTNAIIEQKKIVPINYYLAAQAALISGVSESIFKESLQNFKTLAHRIEFVTKKRGVSFYDDSASTVPEATQAAIATFGNNPLVLILGGRPKNVDYEAFYKNLSKLSNIQGLILIGENRKILKKGLLSLGLPKKSLHVYDGSEMSEIFEIIKSLAKPGDVVLLSPAATAFGTFENYKHRGDEFKKYAKKY